MDSRAPKLASKGTEYNIDFTDPSSGERLGIFHHPKPGTKIMPRSKPTLAEVSVKKLVFTKNFMHLYIKYTIFSCYQVHIAYKRI